MTYRWTKSTLNSVRANDGTLTAEFAIIASNAFKNNLAYASGPTQVQVNKQLGFMFVGRQYNRKDCAKAI